jgi:hypothetical protein
MVRLLVYLSVQRLQRLRVANARVFIVKNTVGVVQLRAGTPSVHGDRTLFLSAVVRYAPTVHWPIAATRTFQVLLPLKEQTGGKLVDLQLQRNALVHHVRFGLLRQHAAGIGGARLGPRSSQRARGGRDEARCRLRLHLKLIYANKRN